MRNNFLRLISALGLFLSVLVMPAKADTGFAIGVIANLSEFNTSGTETEGTGNKETTSTSVSEDVAFGSLFTEVTLKEGHGGITLGLEYIPGAAELGSKSRADTQATDSTGSVTDDDGTYKARAEISDHWTAYIEPTLYANDMFGLYIKGGVSRITVNSLESIAFGDDSSVYGDEDVWGALYGYGIRGTHSSGVLVKLEYSKTDYDQVTLESATGNKNKITANPEQESIRLAIGYQF